MQQVLLSGSFNHRKYLWFCNTCAHKETAPPSSVLQYPQAHPGDLGSRAAPLADAGSCSSVLFCNQTFFSELKSH